MPPKTDTMSTKATQAPKGKSPFAKPAKPLPSTLHCWHFLNRHCKFERSGECPRKHDEALRKKKRDAASTAKKPQGQHSQALQKIPITPYPPAETSSTPSTATSPFVDGSWTKSQWWMWGKANIRTQSEANIFTDYLPELEAGRVPQALKDKWCKRATPAAQFKYFGILSFEVREQIWKYALKDQRGSIRLQFTNDWEFGNRTNVKITNHNAYSPMFYANWQSRQVAIADAELRFGTKNHPANTYFNYRRDCVFFQTKAWNELSFMAPYIDRIDAGRIRLLALPLRDLICGRKMATCEVLVRFFNMRHLTLYAGEGKEDAIVLTAARTKHYLHGIKNCIRSLWTLYLPRKPLPEVHIKFLDAALAHYFGIDHLLYY